MTLLRCHPQCLVRVWRGALEAGTAVEGQAGSRQSPEEAPGGCRAFCAHGRGRGMEQGSAGHFQVLRAMHDLLLPQHSPIPAAGSPLPVQSITKVRDGARRREGPFSPSVSGL